MSNLLFTTLKTLLLLSKLLLLSLLHLLLHPLSSRRYFKSCRLFFFVVIGFPEESGIGSSVGWLDMVGSGWVVLDDVWLFLVKSRVHLGCAS